ncbi:MAG TPA: hypothetical protein VFY16_12515 [Gemmatimonadaceae bacterium]|nr:hypothetical protein [Gemmatimonadaceae bacterium]
MKCLAFRALALAALSPSLLWAQEVAKQKSNDEKIHNARSAAPPDIANNATVMDWPATPGGQPVELAKGSNGWVCYPDDPRVEGDTPMCLDEAWQRWAEAYGGKSAPNVPHVGVAYMLASPGGWSSNTDPYGTTRTETNEWGLDPPHIMIVVPDTKALEGLPTKRSTDGGPWVMWTGTPYAHIMVPVGASTAPPR